VFKGSYFKVSLLFSAAWHLFWISIVYVIVTPTVTLSNPYTEVHFLGPILEKTAFEILSDIAVPPSETLYSIEEFRLKDSYLETEGPKKIVRMNKFRGIAKSDGRKITKYVLSNAKSEPVHLMEGKNNFFSFKRKLSTKIIEGPAKRRELLYKPLMPSLTASIYEEEGIFTVKFKFTLSRDGNVEMIEPITSSGFAFIDQECIKHIKQWKFSSVQDLLLDKDWGIATVRIKVKQN